MFKIKGKVGYSDLEMGTWLIHADDGQTFVPTNMPEQLKITGQRVEITAQSVDGANLFMLGQLIEIRSFHTLPRFT